MKKFFFSLLFLSSFIPHLLTAQTSITKDQALHFLQAQKVAMIDILFSDVNGTLKRVVVPASRFEYIMQHGLAIDGSSIKGLNNIQESDSVVCIDLDSLQLNPFEVRYSTASVFGSIYNFDGTRHASDSRGILETIQTEATAIGYELCAGAELEFFLFKYDEEDNSLLTVDHKGYCDACDEPSLKFFEEELLLALAGANLNCEKMHHEVAPGQYEIVLGHGDALHLADRILYTHHIVKTIANKHNMHATFMPKPIAGINGSGMHIHASVRSVNGTNLFFDKDENYFLSTEARKFIAGLLNHAREMNILFNSSPNSFKRLVPGYEAPFYLCAGNKNRSAAIRIPEVSHYNIENEDGSAVRIELRWPDGNCNPYLALAGLFYAGLEGMRGETTPCSFVNTNLYHADFKTLQKHHIEFLPQSLEESLNLAEKSPFLKKLLGKKLHGLLLEEKNRSMLAYLQNIDKHDPLTISSYELENGVN